MDPGYRRYRPRGQAFRLGGTAEAHLSYPKLVERSQLVELLLSMAGVSTFVPVPLGVGSVLALIGSLVALLSHPSLLWAEPLSSDDLEAIEGRLSRANAPDLPVLAGDVVIIEATGSISASRLSGPSTEYEGLIEQIGSQKRAKLHRRVDRLRFESKGSTVLVRFDYAVELSPKARRRIRVRGMFRLRERTGLANTVLEVPIRQVLKVRRSTPSARDLTLDFLGYRHYRSIAERRLAAFKKANVTLSLASEAPMVVEAELSKKGVLQLNAFERARRRFWRARRHLEQATRTRSAARRRQAKALLAALDAPLPGAPNKGTGFDPKSPTYAGLPLVALYDVDTSSAISKETDSGTLEPVAEYRAGTEGTLADQPVEVPELPPISAPSSEAPSTEPLETVPSARQSSQTQTPQLAATSEGLELVPETSKDFDRMVRRYYLPSYSRSLTLDDPNIGFGGAVRASFAEVSFPEDASVLTIMYSAQAAITPDLGFELMVPTQFVSVQVGGVDENAYEPGNPMLAVKYRFHIRNIAGRRPTITVRARWGLGLFQRHRIPTTDFTTEQFASLPNFVDTHAFLPERSSLGTGLNLAWSYRWLHFGSQLYLDYIYPSEIALEQVDLVALGYGASVGVSLGVPWLTGYIESRATSFVSGAVRTEAISYGGLRAQLFEVFEPALWVGLPIGSISEVTSVQGGIELRFHYDRRAIVQVDQRRKGES